MSSVHETALRLLARREHSAYELMQKLKQRGFENEAIHAEVLRCQHLGLQSDTRFAESLCRARIRQGYGPRRIQQALQAAQVDMTVIDAVLMSDPEQWIVHAREVWLKKYKIIEAESYALLQKQKQFLFYRGFSSETITMMLREHDN